MTEPVELYRFTLGSQIWTYTSGGVSIVYSAETYTPTPLGRSQIESKAELAKANLEITMDLLDPLPQTLITTFNEDVLQLTLYRQIGAATIVQWKGRLVSIKPSTNQLTLNMESIFTSLRRPGLQAKFQKTCRFSLYGRGCNLNPESFATLALMTNVSGTTVTVPDASLQVDGYYRGGMLRAPDNTLGYIVGHTGSTITLQRQIDSLISDFANSGWGLNWGNFWGGIGVKIYPGCDLLRQTCNDKFSNLNNFGGFPWIPSKNPLGGSSIV